MPRLSHYSMTQRLAQYVERSHDQASSCSTCARLEVGQSKRCGKGGFFVSGSGTCKHFLKGTQ